MVVDQVLPGLQQTCPVTGSYLQMGEGISGYRRMASAQFAPGDGTIAVHIDPNGVIEITQRDIPLTLDCGLMNNERKVTVAGLMCEAGGRD
jgi:hypothetical protein